MMNPTVHFQALRVDGLDRGERSDEAGQVGLVSRWTGFARRRPWVSLAVLGATTQAVGLLGVPFTVRAIDGWYKTIAKPSFNPPASIFGPVWTGLYGAMAGSAWLVSRVNPSGPAQTAQQKRAVQLFAGQLALNAAWTPLFFGAKAPAAALVDITALLAAVVATTAAAYAVRPSAGALLVPYTGWVAFATVLNASIVMLNR